MATISYTPKGVCSRKIDIEVEDGIVKKVHFTGDRKSTRLNSSH